MRVTRTSVVILIMLMVLCILAPAAGAIYIEGQQIPNDGLPHILAAESNVAMIPGEASPSDSTVSFPFAGFGGLSGGFPTALVPGSLTASMPVMNNGLDNGGVIGQKMSLTMPADWSLINTGNFRTNMPFLNSMFIR